MGLMLLPVLLGLVLTVPALSPELVQSPNSEALLLVPEQLALTPEQQTRLEEIQTQAATRVHQILTPAQQEQWISLWHNTQPLDLTQEQKKQMTVLRMQVLGQMHQILTPAQRQQWQAQR